MKVPTNGVGCQAALKFRNLERRNLGLTPVPIASCGESSSQVLMESLEQGSGAEPDRLGDSWVAKRVTTARVTKVHEKSLS